MDNSHARFPDIKQANDFKDILNQQHPKIQYTLDLENNEKELNFLDRGSYDFTVHRKDAITNIQVKPHSSHDHKILDGIFKGFVHRAISICSKTYLEAELSFLIGTFVENGYKRSQLIKIDQIKRRRVTGNRIQESIDANETPDRLPIITLPWIPGLSPKLRKAYKKAGYKTVFK